MKQFHLVCLTLFLASFALASNEDDTEDITAVCTYFYNEVCGTNLESPEPVVNENGYYVLDLESYKTALGKTGLFTAAFIESRDIIFADCKAGLEQEKLTPEQVWEGGIEMNAPSGCPFDYSYYFNAQEDPDGFRLENTTIDGTTATTELRYYSGNWTWSVYLAIELKKIDGKWYINKADRLEKEDE